MGQAVTRVLGMAKRPFRNYNVQNRADKVFEKMETIPNPAPKHATSVEAISKFREENPEVLEAMKTKSEGLHDMLKNVYLESKGDNQEIKRAQQPGEQNTERVMPKNTQSVMDREFGVMDIDYAPRVGRMTLKTALDVINQNMSNPETVTPAVIAETYHLDLQQVEDMITHFKLYKIHIPTAPESANFQGITGQMNLIQKVKEVSGYVKLPDNVKRKDAKDLVLERQIEPPPSTQEGKYKI